MGHDVVGAFPVSLEVSEIVSFPDVEPSVQGAKARVIVTLHAALKRRSSTVVLAVVGEAFDLRGESRLEQSQRQADEGVRSTRAVVLQG